MYHYYMFHKPFGCVTARRDDRYPTVMDWFRELDNPRLSPVGRLDRETEGLLLVTDDGQWNRALTRPELHREKCYEFLVLGDLTDEKRAALEQGVLLRGQQTRTAPARITVTGRTTLEQAMPALPLGSLPRDAREHPRAKVRAHALGLPGVPDGLGHLWAELDVIAAPPAVAPAWAASGLAVPPVVAVVGLTHRLAPP